MPTTEQWKKIETLFAEALEIQEAERSRFLVKRCGADDGLRQRVEALLRSDNAARADFLERPAAGPRPTFRTDAPDPLVGRTIGAYAVKDVIARGGMGTVFLAEQASPRRAVALKILSTSLWSDSAARRFEFESQILARLQHSNIAQIFEAGTHRLEDQAALTVRYFAMEYVPSARPITQYAKEQGLETRERLELFLQVCDAVLHGHQKGIIHRDLKPGNILVGGDGRVKVIDFGVARCIDSDVALTTMHTDTGQLIGTLAYMSPEQCDADPLGLDVQSDVYSLGVVLYELICGRLPYEVSKTNVYAATQAIKLTPPARPKTFVGGVGNPHRRSSRDLETVMLKAIEKDRIKRYSDAREFADDIGRYLRREPIAARPPTTWTKAARLAARHPLAVTAIACACIAATALGSTYVAVWWLDRQPDRIVFEREKTNAVDEIVRAVRLVARDGRTIHSWPDHPVSGEQQVNCACLIGSRAGWDGSRLAIVGFSTAEVDLGLRGKLAAYDIETAPVRNAWVSCVRDEDLPANLRGKPRRSANVCQPVRLCSADVFDEADGPEVIAVFTLGEYSQRCLRILDIRGKLLFQIWQDGGIAGTHWLPRPRVLVCAGLDESAKDELRTSQARLNPTMPVVFAIRPEPGRVITDYVHTKPGENPLDPKWYKFLSLAATKDRRIRLSLTRPPSSDPDETVNLHVHIEVGILAGGLHLVIDQAGEELPLHRLVDDGFAALRSAAPDLVPDASAIRLQDEPPDADN